jgi:hypothetical protein
MRQSLRNITEHRHPDDAAALHGLIPCLMIQNRFIFISLWLLHGCAELVHAASP